MLSGSRPALDGDRALPVAAAGVLVLELAVRLAVGQPYQGAAALLLGACGLAVLPALAPRPAATPSVRLALLPASAVGTFSLLATTVALAGVGLTEVSLRATVAGLVAAALAATLLVPRQRVPRVPSEPRPRVEAAAALALLLVVAVGIAAAVDVVRPFPPPGADWGHYLLYAEEVAAQGSLLIDNPTAGGEPRLFANDPGMGAVYGAVLVLDGTPSERLVFGVAVISGLVVASVYAAVAGLWGTFAGLAAAALYAVAPVRLEPLYWHGLATTAALLFVPLALLGAGLLARRSADRRAVGLFAFSLAAVVAVHRVSAVLTASAVALVVLAVVAGAALSAAPGRRFRAPWAAGAPLLAGIALAGVLGAGAVVHQRLQARELGGPLSHEYFVAGWRGLDTLVEYLGWPFLALGAAGLAVVLVSRRQDGAVAALAAFALGPLLATQLWRVEIAFDYRRPVYVLGTALAAAIAVAAVGRRRGTSLGAGAVAVVLLSLYLAHGSIGLRLPERLLSETGPAPAWVDAARSFGRELERTEGDGALVVADGCAGAPVPYLVRQPTLTAYVEWQLGYERLLPAARRASAVLQGGPRGRSLARALGIDAAFVDPRCSPDAAERLGGEVVYRGERLVIVDLRSGRST